MRKQRWITLGVCLAMVVAISVAKAAAYKPINPDFAGVILAGDPYRIAIQKVATVSTSTTLAAAIGQALPSTIIGVLVLNYDATNPVYYECDGTAAKATDFMIEGKHFLFIPGDAEWLADVRLFGNPAVEVGFLVYVLKD